MSKVSEKLSSLAADIVNVVNILQYADPEDAEDELDEACTYLGQISAELYSMAEEKEDTE